VDALDLQIADGDAPRLPSEEIPVRVGAGDERLDHFRAVQDVRFQNDRAPAVAPDGGVVVEPDEAELVGESLRRVGIERVRAVVEMQRVVGTDVNFGGERAAAVDVDDAGRRAEGGVGGVDLRAEVCARELVGDHGAPAAARADARVVIPERDGIAGRRRIDAQFGDALSGLGCRLAPGGEGRATQHKKY
jgi:hypothetical protein